MEVDNDSSISFTNSTQLPTTSTASTWHVSRWAAIQSRYGFVPAARDEAPVFRHRQRAYDMDVGA